MGGPGRRSTELSLSSIVGQPTISTEFKVEPGQQDVACQAVQLCSREVIVKTTAAPPGCLTKVLGSSFPSQDVELFYNLQPDGLDTLHLYAESIVPCEICRIRWFYYWLPATSIII